MKLTAKQERTLAQLKASTTVYETRQIGADLYVRGNNPVCAWVLHADEDKPWPTRWPAERDVYSYAPDGCVAYDVDTPEGAASAHRADTMAFPYRNAYEY
jgi:hypothetical protein